MEKEIRDKQSSIEVSKTSTGKYSWKIKIYFDEEKDMFGDDTILQISEINNKLKKRYD